MKVGYTLKLKRRRSGQTNYQRRLKLLLSRKPRLVVRKSMRNIRAQIIDYTPKGDAVKASAVSSELKQAGWKYSTNSIPAAYLAGLLCGVRAKKAGINDAILDLGLHRAINGTRVYSALKGAIDAGLAIPSDKECFPKEERIKGTHIANYASQLKKENAELYKKRFSAYIKNGADAEKIASVFEEVKGKIIQGKV